MALSKRIVGGNQVRVPDPEPGEATVISRYGRERAMLLHPADFHRLSDVDRLLTDASRLEPLTLTAEAVGAHSEEDNPGEPVTDPAILAELFG